MIRFRFDIEKAISAILFISNQLDKADFHKVFKILYFADQRHLCNYGRPILGDTYIAMKNGPVPSYVYDIVKGGNFYEIPSDTFEIQHGYIIKPKKQPDLDALSETDIEYLQQSIIENKDLSFNELVVKSHKEAWDKANSNNNMYYDCIAKEGGASNEMIEYIKINSENHIM